MRKQRRSLYLSPKEDLLFMAFLTATKALNNLSKNPRNPKNENILYLEKMIFEEFGCDLEALIGKMTERRTNKKVTFLSILDSYHQGFLHSNSCISTFMMCGKEVKVRSKQVAALESKKKIFWPFRPFCKQ